MEQYTIGLYEKSMPTSLTWEEKLVEAKKAGFDFIEISIDETDEKLKRLDMSDEHCLELVNLMAKVGIPIRTMCLSGHRKYPLGSHDKEIRKKGMEIMKKAIQLSEKLGIRIIQLAGYDVYYEEGDEETQAWFEKNLKEAVAMASSAGILMGFETMETDFMNTVKKAMYYVEKINSPYLGVYPDLGNITNATKQLKEDAVDDIQCGAGHLVAMHLKETKPGIFREVPFGTGHVDFVSGIKTAWNAGVRKFVTEFWYVGSPTWKDDLCSANHMMREILDQQYLCKERL